MEVAQGRMAEASQTTGQLLFKRLDTVRVNIQLLAAILMLLLLKTINMQLVNRTWEIEARVIKK
jgi:hypothetical protein